jgi:hypothetical protein
MNRNHIALLFLACALLADYQSVARAGDPIRRDEGTSESVWIHNLDDGIKQAKKSGKPLMVVIRCVL